MTRPPNPWRRLIAGVEHAARRIATTRETPRLQRKVKIELESIEQELLTLLRLSRR